MQSTFLKVLIFKIGTISKDALKGILLRTYAQKNQRCSILWYTRLWHSKYSTLSPNPLISDRTLKTMESFFKLKWTTTLFCSNIVTKSSNNDLNDAFIDKLINQMQTTSFPRSRSNLNNNLKEICLKNIADQLLQRRQQLLFTWKDTFASHSVKVGYKIDI